MKIPILIIFLGCIGLATVSYSLDLKVTNGNIFYQIQKLNSCFAENMNSNHLQKSAILYIRVSTDEQAIKGSSLKTQEELLRQYCNLKGITVDKLFIEDHSAKTFNRPVWKKLIARIKKAESSPDLLLFTRWDRFSRNTGDAYYAIKTLQQSGVNPIAIEQPLDVTIPENKLMLAFYLAIPEVENDRRGLNVQRGMQNAKEQGKWIGPAPLGYQNICSPDGIKSIIQKEPDASILRIAFEQVASFTHNASDAYRYAVKSGLNCSQSNFFRILRNPAYAGNIKITGIGTIDSHIVPGLHVGIVSSETFDKVQKLFYNEVTKNDIAYSNRFPLRGFLKCPQCNKVLKASTSSGRYNKYSYYHCLSKCGYRIRVEALNEIFIQKLKTLIVEPEYLTLYKSIVENFYQQENRRILSGKAKSVQAIDRFADRITNARNLLLDGLIEFGDFEKIKMDFEAKIAILGDIVLSYSKSQLEFTRKVNNCGKFLSKMDAFFCSLNEPNKRSFLNQVLVKATVWHHENLHQIFNPAFQKIYSKDYAIETPMDNQTQVRNLLENLSKIELSMSNLS
jgi:DNA invertase Pin-like site-specific DNA recombinase